MLRLSKGVRGGGGGGEGSCHVLPSCNLAAEPQGVTLLPGDEEGARRGVGKQRPWKSTQGR